MKYIFLILNLNISIAIIEKFNLNISIAVIEKLNSTNPVIVKYQDIAISNLDRDLYYFQDLNKIANNINNEENKSEFNSSTIMHRLDYIGQSETLFYSCNFLHVLIEIVNSKDKIWTDYEICQHILKCHDVFGHILTNELEREFRFSQYSKRVYNKKLGAFVSVFEQIEEEFFTELFLAIVAFTKKNIESIISNPENEIKKSLVSNCYVMRFIYKRIKALVDMGVSPYELNEVEQLISTIKEIHKITSIQDSILTSLFYIKNLLSEYRPTKFKKRTLPTPIPVPALDFARLRYI